MVLLTNYFAESQLNRLNNMGIGKYFRECYGEHIIKPYKQAYLSACGDKRTSECVMIGDSLSSDINPAKALGMKTIYISKDNENTDSTINDIRKLKDIL